MKASRRFGAIQTIAIGCLVVGVISSTPVSGQSRNATSATKSEPDAKQPDVVTDAEIQRLVDRLFQRKAPDDDDELRLCAIGRRALPFLLRALEKPEKVAVKFGDAQNFVFPSSPLYRICQSVTRDHLPEIVEPLAKYLNHADSEFREDVARALGKLGARECIGPVLKALDDKDESVRRDAMYGVREAIKEKECAAELRAAVFPILEKQLHNKAAPGDGGLPKLLLEIDPVRAIPLLHSAEILSLDNLQACHAIAALNEAKVKIPHERLLPYLKGAKPLAEKDTHDYAYCEALKAYGLNPDADAESTLRAELKTQNLFVPEGAAEGLAILFGVQGATRFVDELEEKIGFEKLTETQRNYHAVAECESCLFGGGYLHYFEGGWGIHWKECLTGLDAIGAVKSAATFRKVLAVFEPATPETGKDKLRAQVAAFTPAQKQKLADLRVEHDSSYEYVHRFLAVYAADHAKDFRK